MLIKKISTFYNRDDPITNNGKISGTRYCKSETEKILKDICKEFVFHNPLHASEFPGIR